MQTIMQKKKTRSVIYTSLILQSTELDVSSGQGYTAIFLPYYKGKSLLWLKFASLDNETLPKSEGKAKTFFHIKVPQYTIEILVGHSKHYTS